MRYHLRGCLIVGYLLRIVKSVLSQMFKRNDWNHNPIVLLKSIELIEPQVWN